MSTILGNGTVTFGDGSTLSTNTVPWSQITGKPSVVLANLKSDPNWIGAYRGVATGVTTVANCGHTNGNATAHVCQVANNPAYGVEPSQTYLLLDSGSTWDAYYYYNNCNCSTNCDCLCGKIICTKLFQIGMMPYNIFAADQQYGEWLKKNDRVVYRGYVRWARIVTAWIDGNGPDFMIWIKDKEKRKQKQREAATKWAYKIATPWSEHMAYLMGAIKNDNVMGRIIMNIGRPICKIVFMLPKKKLLPEFFSTWTMWSLFFFSYYTSFGYSKLSKLINKTKLFALSKESKPQ